MKVLFVQHDHVSPLGPVGERFQQLGFEIETMLVVPEEKYREPNIEVSFPDYSNYDVIIPLGSPWGAWDDACIGNWLQPELNLDQSRYRSRCSCSWYLLRRPTNGKSSRWLCCTRTQT
jgi:hypothetical protein